jgi:hypothetical protein
MWRGITKAEVIVPSSTASHASRVNAAEALSPYDKVTT